VYIRYFKQKLFGQLMLEMLDIQRET